jgi:hypothetical protein
MSWEARPYQIGARSTHIWAGATADDEEHPYMGGFFSRRVLSEAFRGEGLFFSWNFF